MLEGLEAARTWLGRYAGEITERPHLLIQVADEAFRGVRETAVVVETELTIGNGSAAQRAKQTAEWKRRGEERWTVLFYPRALEPHQILGLRGYNQVIKYPMGTGAPGA